MMGTKLRGRYRIIKELGSGGFGDTYLALDQDLPGSPQCVVKHLKPKDPHPDVLAIARRLFKTEAEVLYRLKHERIPELFAHFEENGEFYLVQDFIDGDDLSKTELAPGKKLSEAEVIELLQGILEVLEFVHQQKTIHRDIKPQNLIRRRQDGKLFLIDFGAVKEIGTLVADARGQTRATVTIGTHGYMPSEQSDGQPQLCSDIYAVGMIGIQALTGIEPRQLLKDPKTLEVIWRNQAQVSPQLAGILDKMVRYHFNQRYPSAVEALQALKGLKTKNKRSRHKLMLGAIVALLVGLSAWFISEFRQNCCLPPVELANYSWQSPNSAYRITMNYPKDWKVQSGTYPITADVDIFESPQESNSDFQEQMIINVETIDKSMDLNEYTNELINQIQKRITDFNLLDKCESEITLADSKTMTVCYTGKEEGYSLKYMLAVTLNGNEAYYVTYIAETDKYEKFLKPVKDMIKSFKIVETL